MFDTETNNTKIKNAFFINLNFGKCTICNNYYTIVDVIYIIRLRE